MNALRWKTSTRTIDGCTNVPAVYSKTACTVFKNALRPIQGALLNPWSLEKISRAGQLICAQENQSRSFYPSTEKELHKRTAAIHSKSSCIGICLVKVRPGLFLKKTFLLGMPSK